MERWAAPRWPPFTFLLFRLRRRRCEKIQIWVGKTLLVVQGTEKFVRLRRTKIGGTGMIPNGYPAFREGMPATWNKTISGFRAIMLTSPARSTIKASSKFNLPVSNLLTTHPGAERPIQHVPKTAIRIEPSRLMGC